MSDKVYLGRAVMAFESAPAFAPYSKVVVWYDEEHAFAAGDDSGRTLEADLPWATQAIADDMLARISGFIYHPFEAQGAILDPAAELGDGVTVNGVYAPLATMNITFGRGVSADISAPADEEIDHEIPYQTPTQRALSRKVTLGKSYYGTKITRANGLEIAKIEADGTEKGRVVLNSDVQAFYNDDGQEALYFDINAGKYRFRGDVEITGGTMNVNNNFIVDADGNLTINGDINLSGGKITWGENYPSGGISEDQAEEIASTVVTEHLVMSPTIAGAKIYAYDGSPTYTSMTDTGFFLYHTDTANPKAILAADNDQEMVSLVLGAGNSNLSDVTSRLFIQKERNAAKIHYYDAAGNLSGFTLKTNGEIVVHGTITGLSAVFS